jgi:hypothetical protein
MQDMQEMQLARFGYGSLPVEKMRLIFCAGGRVLTFNLHEGEEGEKRGEKEDSARL